MSAKVQQLAPNFSAQALLPNGTFGNVSLSQFKGKYVVLFFYPLDFTFVCPTEIIAFSDRIADFEKLNTAVIACSVDSTHSHLAWTNVPRNQGGLGKMNIPILSDLTKTIAKDYGVLLESGDDAGVALRGTFVIDPKGNLRIAHVNDLPVGRSVDEVLRVIEALQFNAEHGDVCPANWKKGAPTMKADPVKSKEYFSKFKKMKDFILGMIFGVFVLFVGVFVLLDKNRKVHLSKVPQQWPAELEDYLRQNLSRDDHDRMVGDLCMSPTVDASWMNLLVIRYFLSLRSSDAYKESTLIRISSKMNSSLKKGLVMNLVDLDLGDHAPKIIGARVIKDITDDLAIQMECDIVYQGGASIAIETVIAGGIKFPARIYLNGFAGQLRIRLPSLDAQDMLGVTFVQDPGVTFTIDAPLSLKTSETIRGIVNRVLESIVRKLFLDLWVLPSWRMFYLPMMFPNQNLASEKTKDQTSTSSFTASIASKAATLWENRAPLLKFKSTTDFDPFEKSDIFSTETDGASLSIEDAECMSEQLKGLFLKTNCISETQNLEDTMLWKLEKTRAGIDYFKRSITNHECYLNMFKGKISVKCELSRVFSLLSHTEHIRYLSNLFENAVSISQFGDSKSISIEKLLFKQSRGRPIITKLFQVKQALDNSSFIVAFRSVHIPADIEPFSDSKRNQTLESQHDKISRGEIQDNELRNRKEPGIIAQSAGSKVQILRQNSSIEQKVYLFGYLIEKDEGSTTPSSIITLLSCVSPGLSNIFGTFKFCVQTKSFIEELISLTSTLQEGGDDSSIHQREEQDKTLGKLKTYFGSAAAYLMKNQNILKLRDTFHGDEEQLSDNELNGSKLSLENSEKELILPQPFDDQNYVDRRIKSREVLKISLEYAPSGDDDTINWEFMSLTELPIFFSIDYIPSNNGEITTSYYERLESGAWIIFPYSCVFAYDKPAFGKQVINNLPKGQFVVTFDNLATGNRADRELTTRCWISKQIISDHVSSPDLPQKLSLSECYCELLLPRNSVLTIPIPFHDHPNNERHQVHLSWSIITGGVDIYFAVFYQDFHRPIISMKEEDAEGFKKSTKKISKLIGKAKDAYKEVKTVVNQQMLNSSPDISLRSTLTSRLNAVISKSDIPPKKQVSVIRMDSDGLEENVLFIQKNPDALAIFPYSKVNSGDHHSWTGTLEISEKPGLYTILCDNSPIIGSSKRITGNFSITRE